MQETYILKSMMLTWCDTSDVAIECPISFLLYGGALRLWLPRNRVHGCVCPLGPIHHSDLRAGTSVGENKRKRRGHAIAAKFTWKLKGGSIDAFLHKIDVSRIMRGDIFIPRHVSVRVQRQCRRRRRRPPRLINHLAWIYVLIKKEKSPLRPSDGVFSL